MKLLFVKGDRGLVANFNGKFCFPDKKSNIKEEGFYDCEFTHESSNYNFVSGTKIETKSVTNEFIEYLATRQYLAKDFFDSILDFKIFKLGTDNLVALSKKVNSEYGYFDGESFVSVFTVFNNDSKLNYHKSIYDVSNFEKIEDLDRLKIDALYNILETITDDNMLELVSKCYCSEDLTLTLSNVNSVKIVDNKFVSIEVCTGSFISKSVYGISKDYGVVCVSNSFLYNVPFKEFKGKDVDLKVLNDYCIEKCIGRKSSKSRRVENTPLLRYEAQVGIYTVSVVYFDGSLYSIEAVRKYGDEVYKSVKGFKDFGRKIGSSFNRNNASMLSKVTMKTALGLQKNLEY